MDGVALPESKRSIDTGSADDSVTTALVVKPGSKWLVTVIVTV